MAFSSLQIHLEVPPSGSWRTGDIVRGTVQYSRNGNALTFKVVQLTLFAQAKIVDKKKEAVFTAMKKQFVVHGGGHLKVHKINPGHHTWPFNIQYPGAELPAIGQAMKHGGVAGKITRVQIGFKVDILLPQGAPKHARLLLDVGVAQP
jgi:hypothetical protein